MKRKTLLPLLAGAIMALASCGGTSSPSESSGASSAAASKLPEFNPIPSSYTPKAPESWSLKTPKITNALSSDFAWGVDCSSVIEVEKGGGKYYDAKGNERDLFELMADGGATHSRIRLWNNPYDANGKRYGGGTNDLATDIQIAKRAQKAGLKTMLDFHFSDSWVDPGKYFAPKEWRDLDFDDKLVKLVEFTRESLTQFYLAGIEVTAVQLGNEINPGIAGVPKSNYQRIAKIISSASAVVKEIYPSAKTIVHYTSINNPVQIFNWVSYLKEHKALPDVVGVSYYPYWHGDLANLQYVLDKIVNDNGCEVQVVETAWGNTDDPAGDYSANNQFNSSTLGEAGGYETSVQAQVTELGDIVNVLSKVPNKKGTGIYYWEPAWLPNAYSGWITKEGAYYNDKGRDFKGTQAELDELYSDSYCWSSWANQGFFDYDGNILESAYAYRYIASGEKAVDEEIGSLYKTELDLTLNLSDEWALPTSVRAISNLGAYREVAVTWDAEEAAAIVGPGHYVVHGTANGMEVTLKIKAEKNFIKDPGFEKQGCTTESAIIEPWQVQTTKAYKDDIGDAHIEAKNEFNNGVAGNQYLHWYSNTDFEFTLSQNLGTVPAGKYNAGFYIMSSWYEGESGAAAYEIATFTITIDGTPTDIDVLHDLQGYGAGIVSSGPNDITLSADAEVSIALHLKGGKGAWGHADDFYFSAVIE